jgi:hypothetical protein
MRRGGGLGGGEVEWLSSVPAFGSSGKSIVGVTAAARTCRGFWTCLWCAPFARLPAVFLALHLAAPVAGRRLLMVVDYGGSYFL